MHVILSEAPVILLQRVGVPQVRLEVVAALIPLVQLHELQLPIIEASLVYHLAPLGVTELALLVVFGRRCDHCACALSNSVLRSESCLLEQVHASQDLGLSVGDGVFELWWLLKHVAADQVWVEATLDLEVLSKRPNILLIALSQIFVGFQTTRDHVELK